MNEYKALKCPPQVPAWLWNDFVDEMEKDFAACSQFEPDSNGQILPSDHCLTAITKLFLAISCSDDAGCFPCPNCGSKRIIGVDDWNQCLSCGKKDFSLDPPPYWESGERAI